MEISTGEAGMAPMIIAKKKTPAIWRQWARGQMIDCSNGWDYWTIELTDAGFEPVLWLKIINLSYPVSEVHEPLLSMTEAKRYVEGILK